MQIISSDPSNNGVGVYLDSPITLTFDNPIEASFANSSFFQIYKTNEEGTEFYSQIGLNFNIDGNKLVITPMVIMQATSYYMLIVLGGTDGIADVSGTNLSDNYTLKYRTGSDIKPGGTVIIEQPIGSSDPFVPTQNNSVQTGSIDLFVQSGEVPINFITSIPSNQSIGVTSLDKIILIYDSQVSDQISSDVFTGRWATLPVDRDPLGERSIKATSVQVVGNRIAFTIEDLSAIFTSGTVNTEFVFTLPMYTVKGTTKTGYDTTDHRIRFAGKLEPLYATPDQIKKRLTGFGDTYNLDVSDYDLYKLIHEKSSLLKYVYNIPAITQADLIRLNNSTICLVLKDLVGLGTLLNGNIKSRQILQDTVVYENESASDILEKLAKCVQENTPEVATTDVQVPMAIHGIKSGEALNATVGRDTKELGISRRSMGSFDDNMFYNYR